MNLIRMAIYYTKSLLNSIIITGYCAIHLHDYTESGHIELYI